MKINHSLAHIVRQPRKVQLKLVVYARHLRANCRVHNYAATEQLLQRHIIHTLVGVVANRLTQTSRQLVVHGNKFVRLLQHLVVLRQLFQKRNVHTVSL